MADFNVGDVLEVDGRRWRVNFVEHEHGVVIATEIAQYPGQLVFSRTGQVPTAMVLEVLERYRRETVDAANRADEAADGPTTYAAGAFPARAMR